MFSFHNNQSMSHNMLKAEKVEYSKLEAQSELGEERIRSSDTSKTSFVGLDAANANKSRNSTVPTAPGTIADILR